MAGKKRISKQEKMEHVLTLLRKGPCTGKELRQMGDKEIPKSSLTDIIKALRAKGYQIEQKGRGPFTLTEDLPELDQMEQFDKDTATEWMILFLLSRHENGFPYQQKVDKSSGIRTGRPGLVEQYQQFSGTGEDELKKFPVITRHSHGTRFSQSSFDKYKENLKKKGYIRTNQYDSQSPIMCYLTEEGRALLPSFYTEEEIENFNDHCRLRGKCSQLNKEMEKLYEKFREKDPYAMEAGETEHGALIFGRRCSLSEEVKEKLEELMQLPYSTHPVILTMKNGKVWQEEISHILYNTETNMIYLLCDSKGGSGHYLIRLDRVKEMSCNMKEKNLVYHRTSDRSYIDQMWAVSDDQPVKVRVRFENRDFIRRKVERIVHAREKTSGARISKWTAEYIEYEDTVVGLSDFSRYLRRFGSSVIVMEPPELAEQMCAAAEKLLSRYAEEEK
ncbi:MAG: WYL domain-containing protein [Eubacterium sp.]